MFAIARNYSIMYIQKKIYFSFFSFFLYDPRLCSLKPALIAFMHAQGKFVYWIYLRSMRKNNRFFILCLQAHIFACSANGAIFWPVEMAYGLYVSGAKLNYF